MRNCKIMLVLLLLVVLFSVFGCSEKITYPGEEDSNPTEEGPVPFITIPEWLQGYWAIIAYNNTVAQTLFMDAKVDDLSFPDDHQFVSIESMSLTLGLDLSIISNSNNRFSFRLSKTSMG